MEDKNSKAGFPMGNTFKELGQADGDGDGEHGKQEIWGLVLSIC